MRAAIAVAGVNAESFRCRLVTDAGHASSEGFAGSPTILIDGVDLFRSAETTRELACRVYASEGRLVGVPTVDELTAALLTRKAENAES